MGCNADFGPNWVHLEWEARVFRHLTKGLGLGGIAVLAGVLTGCSSLTGQPESTAAIAGPNVAAAADGTLGQGTMQANAQGTQPMTVGKAITLVDATCDQIKAEAVTFEADKIPQKLADFGKAKYHPTAEESIRFARYVDVTKASKDKNCSPGAKPMKKQVTAKANAPVDPATGKAKKVMAKAMANPAATAAVATPTTKIMKVVKKTLPAAAAAKPAMVTPDASAVPVDEGVTVTVPDSSG